MKMGFLSIIVTTVVVLWIEPSTSPRAPATAVPGDPLASLRPIQAVVPW